VAWQQLAPIWPLLRAAWSALAMDDMMRLPDIDEIYTLLALFRPMDEMTKLVSIAN
jgi:hypothetical protein